MSDKKIWFITGVSLGLEKALATNLNDWEAVSKSTNFSA